MTKVSVLTFADGNPRQKNKKLSSGIHRAQSYPAHELSGCECSRWLASAVSTGVSGHSHIYWARFVFMFRGFPRLWLDWRSNVVLTRPWFPPTTSDTRDHPQFCLVPSPWILQGCGGRHPISGTCWHLCYVRGCVGPTSGGLDVRASGGLTQKATCAPFGSLSWSTFCQAPDLSGFCATLLHWKYTRERQVGNLGLAMAAWQLLCR